ncbi:pPIWI-associating nuclease domain-containing protein [Nitrospira sp. Nam80]
MENIPPQFRAEYRKVLEDYDRWNNMLKYSLGIQEELERAMKPLHQWYLDIPQMIDMPRIATMQLTRESAASQLWQTILDQAMASQRILDDLKETQQRWLNVFKPTQDTVSHLGAAMKLPLGNVAHQLIATERIFAGIDFDAWRLRLALPEQVFHSLEHVIEKVGIAYKRLADSTSLIANISYLPELAVTAPTREIFTFGHAINAIYSAYDEDGQPDAQLVAEIEEETSDCVVLLRSLDPALARPYIGAREALRSHNPDRVRHILTSLRELWSHLFRRLAPDESVMDWIGDAKKELLQSGRPTRRARVLYICRDLNHSALAEFVVEDTRALVKLCDFLNHVHELTPELTDVQLRALFLKSDSWLLYLLRISG